VPLPARFGTDRNLADRSRRTGNKPESLANDLEFQPPAPPPPALARRVLNHGHIANAQRPQRRTERREHNDQE